MHANGCVCVCLCGHVCFCATFMHALHALQHEFRIYIFYIRSGMAARQDVSVLISAISYVSFGCHIKFWINIYPETQAMRFDFIPFSFCVDFISLCFVLFVVFRSKAKFTQKFTNYLRRWHQSARAYMLYPLLPPAINYELCICHMQICGSIDKHFILQNNSLVQKKKVHSKLKVTVMGDVPAQHMLRMANGDVFRAAHRNHCKI